MPGRLPAQQYVISTFAGGGFPSTPAIGTNFTIGNPGHVTTDGAGNIYFVSLNCAFKLDAAGVLTRLAGTGAAGYSGDGGTATAARMSAPHGIAIDNSGNLYIADTANSRIRKITPNGTIVTIVGTGTAGYSGDGGPAAGAQLNYPGAVALDSAGNLYILDSTNARVRKVSTSGLITTVAGNGTPGLTGDGGPATKAEIGTSGGLTLDKSGNLYLADLTGQRIRMVSAADGTITTLAGTIALAPGVAPVITGSGGPAIQAQLNMPRDVAVDGAGNIYIAEATDIRVISPDGIIEPIVGSTGPANDPFIGINTVALDGSGNVYVADATSRIREISPAGATTIIAGPRGVLEVLSNMAATTAQFSGPQGVAADGAGNVLVADTGGSWLWRVKPGGTIAPIGDPTNPVGVAVDSAGNYYAATAAQVWKANFTGPVPPAPFVVFSFGPPDFGVVGGIAVDNAGNMFIADMANAVVNKVAAGGTVTVVAGSGTRGSSGDGGQATSARLSGPRGVAVDSAGNLYITDTGNYRIRKVTPGGIITTVAGGGTVSSPPPNPFPTGDGGQATSAILDLPTGVAVDGSGNIYIADQGFSRIRKVTANGIINTIAGNGTQGYSGDGGLATAAEMNSPVGVAVDSAGNVYVAEQGSNIVRLLQPSNAPVLINAVVDAANERQGLGDLFGRTGDDDLVEGSGFGPTLKAVADPGVDVFVAQTLDGLGRDIAQSFDDFDGIDVFDQWAEDRRLVAAAGADLQHAVGQLGIELFGHVGDDVGRRDRLRNRQSAVPCRDRRYRVSRNRHEFVPGRRPHRIEYPRVFHPSPAISCSTMWVRASSNSVDGLCVPGQTSSKPAHRQTPQR